MPAPKPRLPAALVAAALLALAAPALAQAPAAPAAPATAAPATPPAVTPPAPSPAALAAAREIVVLSGLSRNFEGIMPQFVMQAREGLVRMRPELASDISEAIDVVSRDLDANRDEIVDLAARLYAVRMGEAELRDTVTFFRSPSGRKFLDVQPGVVDDVFGEMQVWTTRLSAAITEKVRAELRKKGKDF